MEDKKRLPGGGAGHARVPGFPPFGLVNFPSGPSIHKGQMRIHNILQYPPIYFN